MFETLSSKLNAVFDKLKRRSGALTEAEVDEALREVRVALLEADVSLSIVKDFISHVKEKAIGQDVVDTVTPGQMVIKIVHDYLIELLGEENVPLNTKGNPPICVMLVGLQGSGKTTSTAKLARKLKKENKKILMASLDVYRPAAMDQLAILGDQIDVDTLPIIKDQKPVEIAKRAQDEAKKGGYDILMLDTAGRLHLDETLMQEVADVKKATSPHEVLLVADAMTGQDAVNIAKSFNEQVGLTGIILTRIDGDSRGGAALSMRAISNCPIKFVGTGEKTDQLDAFHPQRIADRILGMGDIVSLVEQAAEKIDHDEADRLAKKLQRGTFDLSDMAAQLKQMNKMGSISNIMGMLPGANDAMKQKMEKAGINDQMIAQQLAIINSMTPKERRYATLLNNASRKKRIATGSGTTPQDINKLLKQYKNMQNMMKRMKKLEKKGLLQQGMDHLFNR